MNMFVTAIYCHKYISYGIVLAKSDAFTIDQVNGFKQYIL